MSGETSRSPLPTDHERTSFGTIEIRHHSDELTVELRAHSAADLFRLAAWALARVEVKEWPDEETVDGALELESDGWDDLLVNWMNQLLFLSERHRAAWTEARFSRLEESGLAASVRGRAWPDRAEAMGREVKSVSYSGLELVPGPSLWMARVTLDL
jgi:SHS2 domain-containing protein